MKTHKIITAKLKETPEVVSELDDIFKKHDWITGSAIIENAKRRMLAELKGKLHERIAVLSIDDISFKLLDRDY